MTIEYYHYDNDDFDLPGYEVIYLNFIIFFLIEKELITAF